jgi:L-alanine-DL-glutamate epimerase-like enolase superfamily enzyme
VSTALHLRALAMTPLVIPFTIRFTHASADRGETSSVVVAATADDGRVGVGEGCPRPYVTGETVASALAFFAAQRHTAATLATPEALAGFVDAHAELLDGAPAAWCAIELALLDLFGQVARAPIEALLGLAPLAGEFQYSAVLGDMAPAAFTALATRYHAMGLRDFKVKLSGDAGRDRAKLAALAALEGPLRVRADANNLWSDVDEAAAYVRDVPTPLFALEEPLTPAGRIADLAQLSDTLAMPIVVDESVATAAAVAALPGDRRRWIVNLRVSKMGGLRRSLAVVAAARRAGIGVIVGAQVGETSRLTRAGLTVAHAAADCLVAQEGAFGTLLLAYDVCDPPLMFGAGGRLAVADHPRLLAPGLGIEP